MEDLPGAMECEEEEEMTDDEAQLLSERPREREPKTPKP